jgi:hypothetical protein
MTEASDSRWRKSSFSGGGGEDCVEVASFATTRMIALRDSKNPTGPRLHLSQAQWSKFIDAIKGDEPHF